MEAGTSVLYRSTEHKTEEQKNRAGLGTSSGVPRGVSSTMGNYGLCVVHFLTRSDSGTRDYTVYVVALLVME